MGTRWGLTAEQRFWMKVEKTSPQLPEQRGSTTTGRNEP